MQIKLILMMLAELELLSSSSSLAPTLTIHKWGVFDQLCYFDYLKLIVGLGVVAG